MTRTRPLLLVVDDDPVIGQTLCAELAACGYDTLVAADGMEGLQLFETRHPDLVLTDLAMPRCDGFSLIASIRKVDRTPIIIISVREGDADKIRGLDLGADDYVTKPFSMPEVLARVRAQLRRLGAAGPSILEFPGLRIDRERRLVTQGERDVKLTPTEFAILELLALQSGKPVSMATISERVWKGALTSPDTVRVHVSSLRRKVEPEPSTPRYIVTEPWFGYRFVAEPVREER